MAFICTIPEGDTVPLDVFTNGTDHVVQALIGYDDFTDCTYSLMVALSPMHPGVHELGFSVVEVDVSEHEHMYWDGRETKRKISNPKHRAAIRVLVCAAVDLLVREYAPSTIWRTTHTADLPTKALRKHEAISRVLVELGYIVREAEKLHGRRLWIAERAS